MHTERHPDNTYKKLQIAESNNSILKNYAKLAPHDISTTKCKHEMSLLPTRQECMHPITPLE